GRNMSKSCKGLAMELVKCLSESDCVKVEKRPYRECAGRMSPSISSECVGLRETYFNCKRGQACFLLFFSYAIWLSYLFFLFYIYIFYSKNAQYAC
ncbi:Pet191_N domain-containing protein, partial [Cephalotus follicularis]